MKNEPFNILLVDDDEDDRMLFTEAFSELKINTSVVTLNDGIQLMEWLTQESTLLPHFLFLDLNMPRKNGMECLNEIKSNDKLKDIFVAIYSTSYNEKDVEETFLNGANVYITKPNNFNALKKVLEKAVMTAHLYQEKTMKKENFLLVI
jgi:CheY-like chemotaxis protein